MEIGEFKAKESCFCLTVVEPSRIRGGKIIDKLKHPSHDASTELEIHFTKRFNVLLSIVTKIFYLGKLFACFLSGFFFMKRKQFVILHFYLHNQSRKRESGHVIVIEFPVQR